MCLHLAENISNGLLIEVMSVTLSLDIVSHQGSGEKSKFYFLKENRYISNTQI